MVAGKPTASDWHEEHLRLAVEAACVALWSWHVDDDRFAMDERAFELWGLPWADQVSFEELSTHIHPADRDRVRAAFSATRSVSGSYEITFGSVFATKFAGFLRGDGVPTRGSSIVSCSEFFWT